MVLAAGCATLFRPSYALRINCGATSNTVDAKGHVWLADTGETIGAQWSSEGGTKIAREKRDVPGVTCPGVYLTETYGMSSYQIKVPNGTYTVRLHFAETYEGVTKSGDRVFTVTINGAEALKDFDPFHRGGGAFRPVLVTIRDVVVEDGVIAVGFEATTQKPEINGIEIISR